MTHSRIQVLPAPVELAKDQYRGFASTTEERQRLTMALELCESLNKFIGQVSEPAKLNVANVCYFDSDANTFVPAEGFIKYHL